MIKYLGIYVGVLQLMETICLLNGWCKVSHSQNPAVYVRATEPLCGTGGSGEPTA